MTSLTTARDHLQSGLERAVRLRKEPLLSPRSVEEAIKWVQRLLILTCAELGQALERVHKGRGIVELSSSNCRV